MLVRVCRNHHVVVDVGNVVVSDYNDDFVLIMLLIILVTVDAFDTDEGDNDDFVGTNDDDFVSDDSCDDDYVNDDHRW